MKNYRCIHVAGTNGKGSVSNYIANILMTAGKSVGLFTSPHLLTWQERIQIDGYNIDLPDEFEKKLYKNGYFLSTTKIAQKYFFDNDIDYAVIETGIGGRKDITMEFDADISVITHISIDHQDILGKKLADIAYQKAGIVRDKKQVYSYFQKSIVRRQLNEQAYKMQTQIEYLRRKTIDRIRYDKGQYSFDFFYKDIKYQALTINSYSKVQVYNAALAIMVCVNEGIEEKYIRAGLMKKIKGRCEVVSNDLVLDVAHNYQSFEVLAKMIKQRFNKYPINFMIALKNTKDFKKISKAIRSVAYSVFLVDMDDDNFYKPKDISNRFKRPSYLKGSETQIKQSFESAYRKTKDINGVLVVAGSFKLTGKIYSLISSE